MADQQVLLYALAGACAFFALAALILLVRGSARAAKQGQTEAVLQSQLLQANERQQDLNGQLDAARARVEEIQAENRQLSESRIRTEVHSRESLRAAEDKIKLLKNAREQMTAEFNNLANRIFDEKTERLLQTNKSSLKTTLNPLKTQLGDFRKKVEDIYDKETRDRVSLRVELEQLKKLNVQISEDAVNLTRALKGDKKVQGNWGEVVLERVLEQSGLRKGSEYDTQVSLQAEDGSRRFPDVIIRLPDNKDVVVDSKVSLVDYEQYVNAESEVEREAALARHVSAIGNHIAGLSIKAYEKLEGIRSLDFVLMFIPIESAFSAAYDANPEMFMRASDKQIVIVSPTTLLVTLRTIQTIWRYEYQNRNAEKIAAQAGGIFDQFALVIESLDEVGRNIDKAKDSFDQTHKRLSTGRGNLVRRVTQLEELGARTKKKLPASVTEVDDEPALLEATPEHSEHDEEK
ncbi:MAG: DNA recombination protein RmuC [Proteobacteria bacterium]|nr:DNA recombination protein RmuC [Pseudomonadota bacterium]